MAEDEACSRVVGAYSMAACRQAVQGLQEVREGGLHRVWSQRKEEVGQKCTEKQEQN